MMSLSEILSVGKSQQLESGYVSGQLSGLQSFYNSQIKPIVTFGHLMM